MFHSDEKICELNLMALNSCSDATARSINHTTDQSLYQCWETKKFWILRSFFNFLSELCLSFHHVSSLTFCHDDLLFFPLQHLSTQTSAAVDSALYAQSCHQLASVSTTWTYQSINALLRVYLFPASVGTCRMIERTVNNLILSLIKMIHWSLHEHSRVCVTSLFCVFLYACRQIFLTDLWFMLRLECQTCLSSFFTQDESQCSFLSSSHSIFSESILLFTAEILLTETDHLLQSS